MDLRRTQGNENDHIDLNRLQPVPKRIWLCLSPLGGSNRYNAGSRGLTPPATQCRPFGTVFGADPRRVSAPHFQINRRKKTTATVAPVIASSA